MALNPIIISIEGNIGAGKSTLLKYINERYPQAKLMDEPVEAWEKLTTSDGQNILQHFYADMDRWAYTFQNCCMLTRILIMKSILDANPDTKLFITERSYLTDKYVFAKMLRDDGKLNDFEIKLYNLWFDNFTKDLPIHTIIWLKTEPSVCLDRIHIRKRRGEEHIPIEYLSRLDMAHSDWLTGDNSSMCRVICVEPGMNPIDICKKYIDPLFT